MSSTRSPTKSNAPTMDIVSHLTARERLLVAQAVYEYGSNAWPDISRVLSKHPLISRPKGFFSPQECQKIYDHLMGEAGYECSDETHAPHAQLNLKLAQKHYHARVIELRTLLLEEEEKFKILTRQIDEIREGRWDEAIAKQLDIGPETANAKPEDEMLAEATNATPSEKAEQAVLPIPDEESMDALEERGASVASVAIVEEQREIVEEQREIVEEQREIVEEQRGIVEEQREASMASIEEQQQVVMPDSQLPPESQPTPTIDISENEYSTHDQVSPSLSQVEDIGAPEEYPTHNQVSPSLSQVEDVGTALEENKVSTVPDEKDVQGVAPSVPSETTLTMISREERTQEELKAIEALEELSRLEPIEVIPVSMQDPQSDMQIDHVADQIDARTLQDYKDTAATPDDVMLDTVKEPLEPLSFNVEQLSISGTPSTLLPGKRKIADVDVASPDPNRDRKRFRDESVPSDDEGGRRRSKAIIDSSTPSTKRFQTVITMLHSQISQHRNGNIFHNPIRESEAPDYHEIVKRPMDLKTIKLRIRDGVISNSDDYQREIYLMFANAMMYNRPKSDIARMAREMLVESEGHIRDFRQTEGFMSRGKR